MKTVLNCWFAVLALVAGPSLAWAQHDKPAIVVSVSSVSETLSDLAYLTKAAGAADVGKTAALFGGAFTQGIDKTRPIGVFISPMGEEFQAVACIPMKNLAQTLELFKEQIGEPRDAGEGIIEVGTNQTFYIKEVGTWAYAAQQFSHLKNVPADPGLILGDLPKKYNMAVQLNVRNIPEHLRTWAMNEIRNGFESVADENVSDDSENAALQRKVGENSLKEVSRLMNEADQVTLGLAIDPQAKSTHLDFTFTAVKGSSLAQELATYSKILTNFGGFVQPDGAVTLNFAGPISADDAAEMKKLLADGKTKALKEIDNDPNLDANDRTIAKEVLDTLFGVLLNTMEEGKLDGGAIVLLDERAIDFAAALRVSDGTQVEQAFRKLVEMAKDDPEFPAVQLDAIKHAGISFHKLTAKIPEHEGEAREIFGETIDVYLGTGPKSVYVASGKKSEALLKRVIDQSVSTMEQPVSPMRLSFALLPFLKFAQSMDNNNQELVDAIKVMQENMAAGDKIRMSMESIPNGTQVRFAFDEGIFKLIGAGVEKANLQVPNLQ